MHAITPRWSPNAHIARHRSSIAAIACAHIAAALLAWQASRLPAQTVLTRALAVQLLAEQAPNPDSAPHLPAPPAPAAPAAPALAPLLVPTVTSAATETAPAPPLTPEPAARSAPNSAAPTLVAPAPPPAPPARRQLAFSAVRYLIPPPAEVPRASRRAGEHGTVWLKVVVSAKGLPVQVTVQRSSGFARLDEQALWAMRQARFQPSTEDGAPVEVEVVAPIEYPAD